MRIAGLPSRESGLKNGGEGGSCNDENIDAR